MLIKAKTRSTKSAFITMVGYVSLVEVSIFLYHLMEKDACMHGLTKASMQNVFIDYMQSQQKPTSKEAAILIVKQQL